VTSAQRPTSAATLQACDDHIVQALRALEAVAVPGERGYRWCLLEDRLRGDALETLLLTCIEHELPFERFNPVELLQHLEASGDSFSCAAAADCRAM
jgi:hypothetical protein